VLEQDARQICLLERSASPVELLRTPASKQACSAGTCSIFPYSPAVDKLRTVFVLFGERPLCLV